MQLQVVNFNINGIDFTHCPPKNWRELQITALFDSDSVNAELDTDNFIFANEAAAYIRDYELGGALGTSNGIYEGLPFKLSVSFGGESMDFEGYLDLVNMQRVFVSEYSVPVLRLDILDTQIQMEAITFELLKQKGLITSADYTDVNYLVEKEFIAAEIITLSLTTYLMARELASLARKIAQDIAVLAGISIAGVTGGLGAILTASLTLLVDIAYAAALLVILIKLFDQIIQYIYPVQRTHKGITFRKALEKTFEYYGYGFDSNIPELDWVYVPSKSELSKRVNEGIPNPYDYGYRCIEMGDLFKKMTNSAFSFDPQANIVTLKSLNDPFWKQNSHYVKPDILDEVVNYNSNEIVRTRIVSYTVDPSDFQTVKNFKGTAYQINTEPLTFTEEKYINIKGYDEIRFPVALCVRKNDLTAVEDAILLAAKAVDLVLNLFGGGNKYSNKIKNRVGLLIQGTRYHAIPKIVSLSGGLIPANYRDEMSAKRLYEKYIVHKSLVANNFEGQKNIYNERIIPMSYTGFKKAVQNKYFTTSDYKQGEFEKIKWGFDLDVSQSDYKIQNVHSRNLKETFIEQD